MPAPGSRSGHLVRLILLLPLLLACLLAALPAGAMQAAADDATPASATAEPAAELPPPDTDIRGRFDFAFDKAAAKLAEVVAKLPLLLVALLIVTLAAWLGGFVSRRLHLLRLRTDNPYMDGLIRNVLRALITLFGVLLALNLLNATALVTAVLGSAGVVGLVLGFAFKDIAENYVAGVLLSLRQPFAPGEHVVIDGNEGKVVALHSRATVLMTLDGNELRLPNALVFKAIVLNYSRNPKRRFDFTVAIDGSQSIRVSHALAIEQVRQIEGVLTDPGPSWSVQEFSAAGIVLRFFGWVDQRESDLGKVRSEAIRRVKAAFARAGIEAPRTTYHVLTAREPGDAAPAGHAEPIHDADADTSVNRDIDEQLAQAQQAADGDNNLLEPTADTP
ncbi:mechanosensitive ion channel family protein [Luteimonas marina]|uniref:Small-conductance mechanosensitive channel n=1 Tax=Luteimonas marina TaxID=488485 RepID=A0A5C5UAR8_9GAMM|nr:mechanosensitive ion channel family protein [Luteimonas marina]TWT23106.1 mechanosensitive ion channel family protein [Luteimonas marina]